MKNMTGNTLLSLFLLAAPMAYGAVPSLSVTVSEAGGKVAFKGTTNTAGTFATTNLKPGNYVVQFNSTNAALKGNQYALVISSGKKKVAANAVAGEKFAGGGVAMKIEVGTGVNIAGQFAMESKTAMKDGKKMVFIRPRVGSNMPGRWVPADSAEAIAAQNSGEVRTEGVRKFQDRGDTTAQGR